MNRFPKIVMAVVIGATLMVLGAAIGSWWTSRKTVPAVPHEQAADAQQDEKKVLYWYDPMSPQQRFDKPGKSPFMADMDLVPKYADAGETSGGVTIDPALTQNLGVRLAAVVRIPLATEIEATGLIGFNERDVAVLQSRSNGFVERVWPLAPGDVVNAGQPLVEVLAPEWTAALHELLALKSTGDAALIAAAHERLRLLGMPEALIAESEQSGAARSRFTLTAPIAGVIQSLEVRTGMTVTTGQTVARINGLATVWLDVAVPEALAGAVRKGAAAEVRLASSPERAIMGRVTTILPALNEAARTLRVRIELPNRDGQLRPGVSAQVKLTSATQASVLAVPTEAVIRTGKRALVMVAETDGRFTPVEVTLGREVGNQTVIASGLNEGQQIVASGQFLIDSEASLKGIEARAGHAGAQP